MGRVFCRNRSISEAKGRFIAFAIVMIDGVGAGETVGFYAREGLCLILYLVYDLRRSGKISSILSEKRKRPIFLCGVIIELAV